MWQPPRINSYYPRSANVQGGDQPSRVVVYGTAPPPREPPQETWNNSPRYDGRAPNLHHHPFALRPPGAPPMMPSMTSEPHAFPCFAHGQVFYGPPQPLVSRAQWSRVLVIAAVHSLARSHFSRSLVGSFAPPPFVAVLPVTRGAPGGGPFYHTQGGAFRPPLAAEGGAAAAELYPGCGVKRKQPSYSEVEGGLELMYPTAYFGPPPPVNAAGEHLPPSAPTKRQATKPHAQHAEVRHGAPLLSSLLSERERRELYERRTRWSDAESTYAEQIVTLFIEGKLHIRVRGAPAPCSALPSHSPWCRAGWYFAAARVSSSAPLSALSHHQAIHEQACLT
jgi:hypothetical protein